MLWEKITNYNLDEELETNPCNACVTNVGQLLLTESDSCHCKDITTWCNNLTSVSIQWNGGSSFIPTLMQRQVPKLYCYTMVLVYIQSQLTMQSTWNKHMPVWKKKTIWIYQRWSTWQASLRRFVGFWSHARTAT